MLLKLIKCGHMMKHYRLFNLCLIFWSSCLYHYWKQNERFFINDDLTPTYLSNVRFWKLVTVLFSTCSTNIHSTTCMLTFLVLLPLFSFSSVFFSHFYCFYFSLVEKSILNKIKVLTYQKVEGFRQEKYKKNLKMREN